ncbi:hypothetical protein PybrP1_001070 [[Pythium] brassicae (nom. inval.)]|nr:hypothetical protein PybrP1_001070 [[Pythium] brassicae (nom. inval.)]
MKTFGPVLPGGPSVTRGGTKVAPQPDRRTFKARSLPPASKLEVAGALYNWSAWLFIFVMVGSQFLSIFWNTVETELTTTAGRQPSLGLSVVAGLNDDPFADRALACVEDGRQYHAVQLSELVTSRDATVVDTTGVSGSGYRLVKREGLVIDATKRLGYSDACTLISKTLDTISAFCASLGYNTTAEPLRVVNGVDSDTTYAIARTLPVVMLPYWDNAAATRFAMPGADGSACMFRLIGKYESAVRSEQAIIAVNRTVREQKTAEWLQRPGGAWRNGWYEDLDGLKWYADVISMTPNSARGISRRQFDVLSRRELDCVHGSECREFATEYRWGSKLSTTDQPLATTSITILNGRRLGLFYYERYRRRVVKCIYDWETFVSNVSVAALLLRWLEAMCALQLGYFRGQSRCHNAGIGCLANSKSFTLLPLVLLPKLKMTLAAFWTVGCDLEGDQKALAEAWFVMYPAIVELVLLYFSLLNIAAKVLRRRISDAPFGPTVLFFCALHRCRVPISQSHWFGIDGRVTTLVLSNDVDALGLADFFVTNAPFRMNGNVRSLIAVKLVVLGLNLLPLLLTRSAALSDADARQLPPLTIEKALAVRCCNLGGLGRSAVYEFQDGGRALSRRTALSSYELVRLGYVVYGDCFVVSISDWELASSLGVFKGVYHLWNHRVALFTLEDIGGGGGDGRGGVATSKSVGLMSEMCRIDDTQLQAVRWWHIAGRPIR